ncbi:T9SS type A sorting domain-containing protein [Empedobacter sp. GD03644]|uniref:M12 family metallo-peptidase n=1 Tax=Empedobacter sp. GD03644 TaxID=2975358 RepID=UPI00244BCA55|nr:M12 family metallo-peptidase [Empedobacter sp. GD03644]MDH2205715.1 T9SS type A sorting domain-containing protein [Empedobacter sp. GD03644]
MKKLILLLIAFVFSTLTFGQERPIAKKVEQAKLTSRSFKSYDVFSDVIQQKGNQFADFAKGVSVFNLEKAELTKLYQSKPTSLTLDVPFEGRQISLELVKNDALFTDNFKAVDQNNKLINYKPGLYYQGIIQGDKTSVVAISIFEDQVIGVASSTALGDVVIGKLQNSEEYVTYSSYNVEAKSNVKCAVDQLEENKNYKPNYDPKILKKTANEMTEKCVRVYYEIAYAPYKQNGLDETKTLNWLTAIHNNIATLYTNDYIRTSLSKVMIWKEQDPYTGNYSAQLNKFRTTRTEFDGDLAHLVNYPSTTSVAYLNSMCNNEYHFAYSGINMTYNNVPVYSWTIMAMTHEMGHALGSPHTHACSWNGDNTAIDGCAPTYDPSLAEGTCPTGPIPYADKGTIMSYCHLVGGVGINFSNGFGEQPGNLIRATVDGKICLSTDCSMTCQQTIKSVTGSLEGQNITYTLNDDVGTVWIYKFQKIGDTEAQWKETTSKILKFENLDRNAYYRIEVANKCTATSNSSSVTSIIEIPGDYCNGDIYYDSGGANGNYSPNENFIKVFKPLVAGEKVSITFTEFDVEPADENGVYDYMNVYNGTSSNASKLFENGKELNGNKIPGPFVSTDDSGAITIRFRSDGGLELRGWAAQINCNSLGLKDLNKVEFNIYPNPTTDFVTLSSKEKIVSYQVFDMSGRLLVETNKIDKKESKIDLSKYPKGVYLLNIKTDKKSYSQKVTKK